MGALEIFTVPSNKQKKDGVNMIINTNSLMKLINNVLDIITFVNLLDLAKCEHPNSNDLIGHTGERREQGGGSGERLEPPGPLQQPGAAAHHRYAGLFILLFDSAMPVLNSIRIASHSTGRTPHVI
jgi:hypothetical protein